METEPTPADRTGTPQIVHIMVGAAWLWLFVAVPFVTDAACDFFALVVLAYSGLGLAISWIIATILHFGWLKKPAWLSVPLAGMIGIALSFNDDGLMIRIALCENALRQYASSVPRGAEPDMSPRWVGLFRVDQTDEFDGGVYMYTTQSFLNRHGVAYIPAGSQPAPYLRVEHLFGPWYRFTWRF